LYTTGRDSFHGFHRLSRELIDRLGEPHDRRGVDLAVIDNLASFLPGRDESHAGLMLEALLPLQRLTRLGLAVLLLHHPKRGTARDGQAARGSGALTGYVDIICCARGRGTRRRRSATGCPARRRSGRTTRPTDSRSCCGRTASCTPSWRSASAVPRGRASDGPYRGHAAGSHTRTG
jgi:hypothetical protein